MLQQSSNFSSAFGNADKNKEKKQQDNYVDLFLKKVGKITKFNMQAIAGFEEKKQKKSH